MLNSRYIHLHQALGLGSMWLNQQARIRPPEGSLKAEGFNEVKTSNASFNKIKTEGLNEVKTSNTHSGESEAKTEPRYPTQTPTNPAAQGNALVKIRQRSAPSHTPSAPQPVAAPPGNPLHTPAPRPAKLLVLSVCPSVDDMAAGKLFSGADGEMLHNMLNAIALPPAQAHFSTWLKNSPDFNPRPDAQTITAAAPDIAREWQQTRAQAMLLLGDFFHRPEVQAALNAIAPAAARYHIPHPMRLAGNPQLKRSAWETLQKLQAALK